ncbi:MAG: nuclear transport factor 2 family protein [Bryobacteraceae bacterium]
MNRLLFLAAIAAAMFAQPNAATFENLDKAWSKAILARDAAALDKLLDDELIYAHSTGIIDTKATYMEKIRSGRQVYKTMELNKVSVRVRGASAVTHSWARITGVNQSGNFDDKLMILHLWVKNDKGWQLVAHQTTKVDKLP